MMEQQPTGDNPRRHRKACSSATRSTANPPWIQQRDRDKKPDTKLPTYSTACWTLTNLEHIFLFSVALEPKSSLSRLIVEISISRTIRNTQPLGLHWVRDQVGAEAATYKKQNMHMTRISVPSVWFEPATREIKRLLSLRPHGRRNRPTYFSQCCLKNQETSSIRKFPTANV
jgi:hypothetical protein